MKSLVTIVLLSLFILHLGNSQNVAINADGSNPNSDAILHLKSTDKGLLIPSMTSLQRTSISKISDGLMVYDTQTNSFWFRDSGKWNEIVSGDIETDIIKDVDNNTKIQVEEGSNDDKIRFDIDGTEHLVIQENSNGSVLFQLGIAGSNTFFGRDAGLVNNFSFPDGASNSYFGYGAGRENISGSNNSFFGRDAGDTFSGGDWNTIIGAYAGDAFTSGSGNTFVGYAGFGNQASGNYNTSLGYEAGQLRTGGNSNTFLGYRAGKTSTTGSGNVFIGNLAGSQATGDDKLYIDNTNTNSPLIYGDFANDIIQINGNVGIGQSLAINDDGSSANSDAILHIKSTDKGLLIPSMTSLQRTSISHVSNGLMVYDTETNSFWFRDSGIWNEIVSGELETSLIEDNDGNTKIQVEEGNDDNTIRFDINGSERLSLYENSGKGRLRLEGQLDINDSAGGGTAPLLHFKASGSERFSMGYNDDVGYFVIKDEVNNDQVVYIKDGKVGIQRSSPTNDFEVGGTASKNAAGDWLANSDARLKKNITPLSDEDVLQKLLRLKGVTYEWNDDKTGYDRPEGIQYGFTAQNIQKVYPEFVTEDNLGYLQTAYGTYDAMYVEAIRKLLNKIESLEARVNQLEKSDASSVAR